MAEPRILVLPFWSLESAFSRHWEEAGASLTLACITQDIVRDSEDAPPDKIHRVITENQAEHLV